MAVRQVRAPTADGAVLAEPPLASVASLLSDNRRILAAHAFSVLGCGSSDLRSWARQTLFSAANAYLRDAGEPVLPLSASDIVMAGHQPELFHPGVWVKNFALNGLAQQYGLTPINLIVDNDTVKSTALHYPAVRVPLPPIREFQPYRAAELFDERRAEEPYEERAVQDEALFASLPDRVRCEWDFAPLLQEFWQQTRRQGQRTRLLGERFAAARRDLERRWGCQNLEVPVSAVCETEPYAWFACELLANLPRLHAAYNDSVHDYRRRYGLRNTSHPVPDLSSENGWLEAPFWAWRSGHARRERLLARLAPQAIELRAGDEPWPALPRDPEAMLRAFLALGRRGYRVRSRALTNTMYARLFLCDLFIHGIGGGKYDEVTDAIIRRYYGAEPPAYLVLSATLLLPLPHYPAEPDDCRRLGREARDLYYNPQRHLDQGSISQPDVAALVGRKRALVSEEPLDRRGRRERFRQIRDVTAQLRAAVEMPLASAHRRLAECEAEVKANAVLTRRDYPFVLYPEQALRPFCQQFLAADALAPLR
jgi:hypothetical protein